ncbi:sugar isomerase [Kribbella sandramycini]|uniref:Glutamine--fructose-6-phosphate aminotransferase [isomerizing] n=1 Tax=Kribbella sandramycini TaxID=60450 RepID=A0A7Y4P2H8_9ACTN|nr:sugar isomerase [Kribbella sandramycini]MBB6567078.1 glucosamine--fructose-6-phosphate aminotransferase (isomerizing) [Kribbella sandramycini]NOL44796.1 sugar isomerase [Kribbella sandramycini]
MSRLTFLAGRDAQPAALARIAAHVTRQLDTWSAAGVLTGRPLFTGIGASFAALAVPVATLRAAGVASQRVRADELGDHPGGFDPGFVVGVSQSGRSAETLAAFEGLTGVPRVALVNVAPAPLTEVAEYALDLGSEPDSYASTVGFTGTIVALDLLVGTKPVWTRIDDLVRQVRADAVHVVDSIRSQAAGVTSADVVAAGASRASAEETALLLREVPRIPATASPTRTYLHGEMESAGSTLHVIFGDGREHVLARTLSAAGHHTLLVTADPIEPAAHLAVVPLPSVAPAVRVVLETVVAQELVAALADERGVPAEAFVFANDDTKRGGVDPADFSLASPGELR